MAPGSGASRDDRAGILARFLSFFTPGDEALLQQLLRRQDEH